MDAATALTLLKTLIDTTEKLLPIVNELFKQGLITRAEQEDLRRRYESLKNKAREQFSAPHWQV
ncbi:hypothetical protein CKA38_14620 [Ereboglobus luteus]|uniref:Uncharacterized protein n=1 Tax=Ereboglobus luteus TaxID=1796921 RepID=A0A2U8E6W7_9BACT|nr:hypothetical protein CKA38_14620 [Ereboglobus luteus]